MTALDIILLLIFIGSAWLGFRKGIIKQLGSLAAIVIAIIACRCLGQPVTEMLTGAHPDWQASPISRATVSILANAMIYLVAYYGVIIVAKLLRMVSHAILLGPLDRIAGAAFSMAKYFLLFSLLLNLYMVIFPDTPLRTKSNIGSLRAVAIISRFAPWVLDAVSPLATGNDQCTETERTDKAPVSTETAI